MPPIGPITRRELVRYLLRFGFEGPFSGGKHEYMERGDRTVYIPNPHQGDIGPVLLMRILRQAGIDRDAWERL